MIVDNARCKLLDMLVARSRLMLEKAEAGEWDSVQQLQGERHLLAENYFSEAMSEQDNSIVATVIEEILNIDKRIQELGSQARDACIKEISAFTYRRNAVQAYATNTK